MFSHVTPSDNLTQARCRIALEMHRAVNVAIKEGDQSGYPYCMVGSFPCRTRTAPSAMDSISSSPGYM